MSDDEIIEEWEIFLQSCWWPIEPSREVMAAMYRKHGHEYMKRIGLGRFKPDSELI